MIKEKKILNIWIVINLKILTSKFKRLKFASRVRDARGDFTGIRFSKLNPARRKTAPRRSPRYLNF